METERLAPQAIRRTEYDVNPTETALMMLAVLLRSCLVWSWRERAVELVKFILASRHIFPSGSGNQTDSPAIPIVLDSYRILLKFVQGPDHLEQCLGLLIEMAQHGLPATSLDPLITSFYRATYRMELPESARTAFKSLQLHGSRNNIAYSPPPGHILLWLLTYTSGGIHDVHCSRQLAHAAYQGDSPVPEPELFSLLKVLAQGDFLEEAEGLWRRHTGMGEVRQWARTMTRSRDKIFASSTVMSSFVRAFSRGSARAARLAKAKDIYGDNFFEPANAPKKTSAELLEFAHTVLQKYVESYDPISKAGRFEVTALARAYFRLGDTEAAVKTMKILLDRRIIPTAQELSTTLANMANLNPRRASRMLQKMLDKGIQPGAVDFSAIIHEASVRGDDVLVGALVAKARELGHEQLSTKGIHSLIQFSLRFHPAKKWERPEEEAESLRRVLRMVKALVETKVDTVPTPWLGIKCARACVRVNQGEMAYEFWQLLVYEKEDWDHESQRILRNRIIRAIHDEITLGVISKDHGRQMISELRGGSRATVGFSGESR